MSVRAEVASIALVTLPLELKLQDLIKSKGGFLTANGAPPTRTVIQRGFGVHFAEDSMEQCAQQVQVYTPTMLNRAQGQGKHEGDPRYFRNSSTTPGDDSNPGLYDPVLGPAAVCWNHLDSGVLSEQYGSLLPKHNDTPTILSRLFPFQVIELGDGFVVGTEKVLTKASGVFKKWRRCGCDCVCLRGLLSVSNSDGRRGGGGGRCDWQGRGEDQAAADTASVGGVGPAQRRDSND